MGTDPFAEGVEARDAGEPAASNPYPKGTPEAEAWLKGWSSRESVDDGIEPVAEEGTPGPGAL
jgi:hypothetical protein